jgi:hypothetical protein
MSDIMTMMTQVWEFVQHSEGDHRVCTCSRRTAAAAAVSPQDVLSGTTVLHVLLVTGY